ncbi:MAG: ATP-binding protein [Acidobacteriota bacterium]|nr:ATP-binding protein [Acidobacteriota bacterium]
MEFSLDERTFNIFNNVFVFFGTLTQQGFVLSLEGRIFEKTSTDPNLLIGQKFSETVYWQSSPHTSENLARAIAEAVQGNSKAYLDFRVNADEKIFIELSLQSFFDEATNTEQIFFCAQDVTTREKEIEYYKARSEQLLYAAENAEIGLWFWNLAEESIFTTPKCNEFFEVAPHDIITFDSFLKVVHPEDRQRVETALLESQTNGTEYNVEYRVLYSDGNIQWLAVRGKTYLDAEGNPESMMGVVRRVTDKKVANEELAKVYEREKKARDEAENANRAKDFFLAVVSHELRSPLNTILGWTKILLTKEVKEDIHRNALETIEKSARSQAKLIDDLIDSARVASGKLRLELKPTNIFNVLKTVFNSQKPLAQAKNINLEFTSDEENIQVFGDAMRLQQIFTNLVSNALKFTPSGGNITIGAQTTNAAVTVFVKDDGQGISSESLPNIFQQFRQGDENTSADHSGLGLGLSIVKILTERHNGKIRVESDGLGQGATFSLTFPLCGSNEVEITETVAAVEKQGKLLNGIKILVIEDDPDSREVLQLFLEQSGAEVESAECASEAMGLIRESAETLPDVIVSDLAMPNEDGYSLLSRIRKLPNEMGGAIPAIALSAFASSNNKKQALDVGFQKYHTKPFEPDGIIQDILNLVKK